jgi:hypothetical protein
MPNGWPSYKGGKGKGKGWGGFSHRDFCDVSDSYLQPLLLHGMQNTLSKRSSEVLERLGQTTEKQMAMRFYVSARVGETNMILSSTDDPRAPSCANAGDCVEEVVGVAVARKTTLFSNQVNGYRVIFNLAGERLGQLSSSFPALQEDEEHLAKWVYANPILDVSDTLTSDSQIIGVLGVAGNDDGSYGVFTNKVFQKEVESISCEVGPYLSLLSCLRVSRELMSQTA